MKLQLPFEFPRLKNDLPDSIVWLSGLYFLSTLVLSVLFYKERIAFQDTSGYLFYLLSNEEFRTPHMRYSALLTQILPLMLIKLHLPLKVVMLGYSINFWLTGFLSWLCCLKVAGSKEAATALVVYLSFWVVVLFFWPVSELFQGGQYVIVLMAYLQGKTRWSFLQWMVLVFITIVVVFSHPIIAIPVVFMLCYLFLSLERTQRRSFFISFTIIAVVFALHKIFIPHSPYDLNRTSVIFSLPELLSDFTSLKSLNLFQIYFFRQFSPLLWVFIAILCYYVFSGNWKKGILLISFCAAYGCLIVISYPQGDSELIFENLLRPLFFAVSICLVYDLFKALNYRSFPTFLLSVLLIGSAVKVYPLSLKMKQRSEWYKQVIHSVSHFPEKKIILNFENIPLKRIEYSWANTYESLLFSALSSPDSAMVICATSDPEFYIQTKKQELQIPKVPFHKLDWQERLPKRYFNVSPTRFKYLHAAEKVESDSVWSHFIPDSVQLHLVDLEQNLPVNAYCLLNIRIKNETSKTLPSRMTNKGPLILRYTFSKADGLPNPYPINSMNLLLMDVSDGITQPIFVKTPKNRGKMTFDLQLVTPEDSSRIIAQVNSELRIGRK